MKGLRGPRISRYNGPCVVEGDSLVKTRFVPERKVYPDGLESNEEMIPYGETPFPSVLGYSVLL